MFTTRSKRRIKVPKELWPEILKRISEGENLQSIADAYDCTIESLSYIIKMTKTRGIPSISDSTPPVQSKTLHLNRPTQTLQSAAPASPTASPAELTDRLTSVTNAFVSSFMSWQNTPSHDTKTATSDSLHELRKILVRIEIMLNSKSQS